MTNEVTFSLGLVTVLLTICLYGIISQLRRIADALEDRNVEERRYANDDAEATRALKDIAENEARGARAGYEALVNAIRKGRTQESP